MLYIVKLLIIIQCTTAMAKVSPFIPKYRLENLKAFVDSKNLYYFNNTSGSFIMNKGFKSYQLIEGSDGQTNYNAFLSPDSKHLIIEKIDNYLNVFNSRKVNEIWYSKVGEKKAIKIGSGTKPKFHLNNEWISFYNPKTRTLYIKNIKTNEILKSITLDLIIDPYFKPDIEISSNFDIIFSQINQDKNQEVILINKENQKKILLNGTRMNSNFSFTTNNKRIFIKESTTQRIPEGSFLNLYLIENNIVKKIYQTSGMFPGDISNVPGTSKIAYLERNILDSKEVPLSHKLIFFDTYTHKTEIKSEMIGEMSFFINSDKIFINHESKVYLIHD